MDGDSRKLMLIAGALGIFFFGIWTLFLVFIALMAESGGKDSNPVLATLLLWPLGETIWSWIWLLRHAEQYSKSSRVRLSNTLFLAALISPPVLTLIMGYSNLPNLVWLLFLPMAGTVVCCHAARRLWSDTQEKRAEHTSAK